METYQFSFEKLEVWNMARQLATMIYKSTQKFPAEEKFSLISQIRRSALSVGANIAEGSSMSSAKDQAHFTTIAFSSLMELFNHLIIAGDLGYLSAEDLIGYRQKIQPLTVKLSNLRSSQLKRIGKLGFVWLMVIAPGFLQPLSPMN
jgi:four helix bundle protein